MMRDVLRAALDKAMKWRQVPNNAVSSPEAPRVPHHEMQPCTRERSAHFPATAASSVYQPVFALLVTTGLRLGEALALRWSDVEPGWLDVDATLEWLPRQPWRMAEPKAFTSRRKVRLIQQSVAAVRAQRSQQNTRRPYLGKDWHAHDFVFTDKTGEPLRQRSVQKAFKDTLKPAGL